MLLREMLFRLKLMEKIILIITLIISCSSCSSKWAFKESPTTMIITQRIILEKKEPVLFVLHDKDGDWHFLANEKYDQSHNIDQLFEISLNDLIAQDSSLVKVAELEKGWKATRIDKQSPWEFSKY
ncbi:MAG: hypothetical protein JXA06_10630 [Bacteroidetes bacterium]|nr:hypothetical protein [Bacteroidota bacterium]